MRVRMLGLLVLPAILAIAFTGCVVHDRDYHREGYYHEERHAPPPPPPIEHHDDVRIDVHP